MRKMFLDDTRMPEDDSWDIVRSYDDAVNYVKKYGVPRVMSLDHDLGDGKTGYDFVKWLVNEDLSRKLVIPRSIEVTVHSANPVGKKNIESYLTPYLDFKYNNDK